MSVDTYLKGKNLEPYRTVTDGDITVHVAPALTQWARTTTIDAVRRLGRNRFAVRAEHRHQPT